MLYANTTAVNDKVLKRYYPRANIQNLYETIWSFTLWLVGVKCNLLHIYNIYVTQDTNIELQMSRRNHMLSILNPYLK